MNFNVFTRGKIAIGVVAIVLLIDQIIKIIVKTHMYLHDSIHVTDWFYIYFTENVGMAFGMEIIGKLFLSLFRIFAVAAITWFLVKIVQHKLKIGFIVCVSLILAGALGNILDSVFYGLIFDASSNTQIATLFPETGGYAPILYGKVVDMFYFPIIDTNWPQWMPLVGGEHFVFFSPIFNFADASISCGIMALLIFYNKYWTEALQSIKKQ